MSSQSDSPVASFPQSALHNSPSGLSLDIGPNSTIFSSISSSSTSPSSNSSITIPLSVYQALLPSFSPNSITTSQHFTIEPNITTAQIIPLLSPPSNSTQYCCYWIPYSSINQLSSSSLSSLPSSLPNIVNRLGSLLPTIPTEQSISEATESSVAKVPVRTPFFI